MADLEKGIDAFSNKDYKKAFSALEPLAKSGDMVAQFGLAGMYHEGFGVPQHYIRAHMWANLATANGHENGAMLRAKIEEKMTPEQIKEAQDSALVAAMAGS